MNELQAGDKVTITVNSIKIEVTVLNMTLPSLKLNDSCQEIYKLIDKNGEIYVRKRKYIE